MDTNRERTNLAGPAGESAPPVSRAKVTPEAIADALAFVNSRRAAAGQAAAGEVRGPDWQTVPAGSLTCTGTDATRASLTVFAVCLFGFMLALRYTPKPSGLFLSLVPRPKNKRFLELWTSEWSVSYNFIMDVTLTEGEKPAAGPDVTIDAEAFMRP